LLILIRRRLLYNSISAFKLVKTQRGLEKGLLFFLPISGGSVRNYVLSRVFNGFINYFDGRFAMEDENKSSEQEPQEEQVTPEPAQAAESAEEPKQAEAVPAAEQAAPAGEVSKDARTWGMLCHLLGLFTNFVGPLVVWLIKKDEDPFIDRQGKEALNFQITVAIAYAASGVLVLLCGIGFITGIGVFICNLIFCIMASVKANDGKDYRYPVSIRLIK
jgi:hypothetical protein